MRKLGTLDHVFLKLFVKYFFKLKIKNTFLFLTVRVFKKLLLKILFQIHTKKKNPLDKQILHSIYMVSIEFNANVIKNINSFNLNNLIFNKIWILKL